MASNSAAATQSATTTLHDARATVTGCMLPEMADETTRARSALGYLAQLQPGLKGAAIFTANGELEACDGGEIAWSECGSDLLRAIDAAVDGSASEAHIATQSGEVFMHRLDGRRLVAVAERFVLASLLSFDMRTALRNMEAGG